MPLPIGAVKGSAYKEDWDKDIQNLYQQQEYAQGIKREKEAITKFYADKLKKGTAEDPRTAAELTDFYIDLDNQVADFVTQHPDFRYDVNLTAKFNDLTAKYLDNDILKRGLTAKAEYDKFRQAAQSGKLLDHEIAEEEKKWQEFSNIDNKGKKDIDYKFNQPVEVEIDNLAMATARAVGMEEGEAKLNKLTGSYESIKAPNESKLILASEATYAEPRNNLAIKRRYEEMISVNPEISKKYAGADPAKKWWLDYIKTFTDIQKVQGDMNLAIRRSLSQSQSTDIPAQEYALSEHVKDIASLSSAKDANGDFIEGSMPAAYYDTNLTGFNESGETDISLRRGVMGLESGKATNIKLQNKSTMFKKTSVGDWVTFGGIPYLQVSGDVYINETDRSNSALKSELTKLGFQPAKEDYQSGFMPGSMGAGKTVRGTRYSGTLLFKLDITKPGLVNWASQHGGADEAEYSAYVYRNKDTEILYYNEYNGREMSKDEMKAAKLLEGMNRYYWTIRPDGRTGIIDYNTKEFIPIELPRR